MLVDMCRKTKNARCAREDHKFTEAKNAQVKSGVHRFTAAHGKGHRFSPIEVQFLQKLDSSFDLAILQRASSFADRIQRSRAHFYSHTRAPGALAVSPRARAPQIKASVLNLETKQISSTPGG